MNTIRIVTRKRCNQRLNAQADIALFLIALKLNRNNMPSN
jgi:hypothetical protein